MAVTASASLVFMLNILKAHSRAAISLEYFKESSRTAIHGSYTL